jgi:type IV pilus assembly protein PilB
MAFPNKIEEDQMSIRRKPSPFRLRRERKLGDVLLSNGLITNDQLTEALKDQKTSGGFLGEIIARKGWIRPDVIGAELEQLLKVPYVSLADLKIDGELGRLLGEAYCRSRTVLPFQQENGEVLVAMADPVNLSRLDELRTRLGQPVSPFLAFPFELESAISKVFSAQQKTDLLLAELDTSAEADTDVEDLTSIASDAPIVRIVNSILEGAVQQSASDIHVEPREKSLQVRYRVDGILHEEVQLPRSSLPAILSRLKIMSGMNIAERRRPQDGRFELRGQNGMIIDMRVSSIASVWGEKIVMRLLPRESAVVSIEKLGFLEDQERSLISLMKRPHGVILVTGPTGSGKSTTMFACLQMIDAATTNVSTIEDPVEYRMPGVNQIPVNSRIGVTFASGLRTLLRQDPDVIMVGEIRDAETAEIAIQAALTGHLVLSTLHTNDAPSSLIRLQNMGVEPYLVGSAIAGVLGQRLVRKVCPNCAKEVPIGAEIGRQLGIDESTPVPVVAGCSVCNNRGYSGRSAVGEVFEMTDELRDMVLQQPSSNQLMALARSQGMKTMKESAMEKLQAGQTTPDEVMRVLFTDA